MKITIYGAGGPVAASAVGALEADHTLLLTDLNPLETKHDSRQVDIGVYDQVRDAAEGADVLINCTVQRQHPTYAFDVNTRGAYNVLKAAVELGIPRVVHTGPAQMFAGRGGYSHDFHVTEEAPPRPGVGLYAITKFLGHRLIEVFCREHPEVSVVAFYYSGFYSEPLTGRGWLPNFAVHADDAGQAFRLGTEIERDKLPTNFELFHISADLPHEHISIEKAKRILGYAPRHNFDYLFSRRAAEAKRAEEGE